MTYSAWFASTLLLEVWAVHSGTLPPYCIPRQEGACNTITGVSRLHRNKTAARGGLDPARTPTARSKAVAPPVAS